MSTSYSVHISLNDETLTALRKQGLILTGFKAVKTSGTKTTVSTVWMTTTDFSGSTKVEWSEQYGAYIDSSQALGGGTTVNASNGKPMNLGQTLDVNGSGVVTVKGSGQTGQVEVKNLDSKPWTTGMTEVVSGSANPLCAFPLDGLFTVLMEPIEKVLLTFRAGPVITGTVEEATSSEAVLITLSGDNPTASVAFDIDKGWDTKNLANAKIIDAGAALAEQLIVPIA